MVSPCRECDEKPIGSYRFAMSSAPMVVTGIVYACEQEGCHNRGSVGVTDDEARRSWNVAQENSRG